MKKIIVNGVEYNLELKLEYLEKAAKKVQVVKCYVPGNFPWKD